MKKSLIALTVLLASVTGCTDEIESGKRDGTPIVMTASLEPMVSEVERPDNNITWAVGDKIGVFVGPTKEMPFKADQAQVSTTLTAMAADIPVYSGNNAYAYYPGKGSQMSYINPSVTIPAKQTFVGGSNPDKLLMAAKATVEDGAVAFKFRHLGGVLEFGLKSNDNVVLSRMTMALVAPIQGYYLAGSAKLDFHKEVPMLGSTIVQGSKDITVSFGESGLVLSSAPVFVPIGVLPFESTGGGVKFTFFATDGGIYDMPAIWTDNSPLGDNGALVLAPGERVVTELGNLASDDFVKEQVVTLTVYDNKTATVKANHAIELYGMSKGIETDKIGNYTTDSQGKVVVELNAGDYRVYSAYDAQTPAKWNNFDFTVVNKAANNFDVQLYNMVFKDDFDWILSTMGGATELKPLYESINPPVANTLNEVQASLATPDFLSAASDRGWVFSSFVYIRPGILRVGKKSGKGVITTPALTALTQPTKVKFAVDAHPWHTVTGGMWKLEDAELVVTIVGSGSFEEGSELKSFTTRMVSEAPATPLKVNRVERIIYGASSDTKITMENKLPEGVVSTMYRIMLDDVKVAEIR